MFTTVEDGFLFGAFGDALLDVDLDQNGVVDFTFRSNSAPGDGLVIIPRGDSRVFTPQPDGNNPPSFVTRFNRGDQIGPDLINGGLFLAESRINPFNNRELGPGLLGCANATSGVVCLGPFQDFDEGFVGVVLDSESANPRYGYISVSGNGFNGGTINSFGVELISGSSIQAGAIPEPSSFLLLSVGAVMLVRRRR